jgi:mRNA interferase RelE/StbE
LDQSYQLKFDRDALKEWKKLDGSIKQEFKKALSQRLKSPVVESARLHGNLSNCFKIKSKKSGHRLIYTVLEKEIVVIVLAIGERDKLKAYISAQRRIR